MADQDLFHIQLHPNKGAQAVEYAKNGLRTTGAIGMDFGPHSVLARRHLIRKPLSAFSDADCMALKREAVSATNLSTFAT
jgi:hypothetical protein